MLSLEFDNVHLVYRMLFFDIFGFVIYDGLQIQTFVLVKITYIYISKVER